MSDCMDVCEVVVDTLMNLGYDIKTEEQDCTDVLDAFCKYNQNYADLLTACEDALEYLPDPESPLGLREKLYNIIYKVKNNP